MQTKSISYQELAEKVGDAVLFNQATSTDVDEFWFEGLIQSPHMERKLEQFADEVDWDTEENGTPTVMDLCEGSIYQTYAVTQEGARFLFNHTAEIISWSDKLGLYLWHITHYGTSWSGVHTEYYDWDEAPDWYAYSDRDIDKYIIG